MREIVAEARRRVWPRLNRDPVRLVSPQEFTRLWAAMGVEFRLAKLGGKYGLALLGFYLQKMGPAKRPLICVNTAHHPVAVGAAFSHEMGHHLTAQIFATSNEQTHYLAYTAYEEHLSEPAELAADSLVSLGVFPSEIARRLFERPGAGARKHRASETPSRPAFEQVLRYFESRYGLRFNSRFSSHRKLQYLAALIHFTKLRQALLYEYDI